MVRSPQAGRPRQAACLPISYVRIHIYKEMLGLALAAHPQAGCLPFPLYMYVCMHTYGKMMGPRQPALGRLLAFPFCM